MMTFPIDGKIKMFQTTNQMCFIDFFEEPIIYWLAKSLVKRFSSNAKAFPFSKDKMFPSTAVLVNHG